MITPQEIAEIAQKKYGKMWQSAMAREVVSITGCPYRRALITIHRLARGISKPAPLVEVAIRLLLN